MVVKVSLAPPPALVAPAAPGFSLLLFLFCGVAFLLASECPPVEPLEPLGSYPGF